MVFSLQAPAGLIYPSGLEQTAGCAMSVFLSVSICEFDTYQHVLFASRCLSLPRVIRGGFTHAPKRLR